MKPKTKLQKQVVELSKHLPAITEEQRAWGIDHSLDNFAVRQRNTLYCLECGQSWKDTAVLVSAIIGTKCPHCRKELKLATAYNRSLKDTTYYAIITTIEDFQVVRIFFLQKNMHKGDLPSIIFDEVLQHWINASGSLTIMSKNVFGLSRYYDQWIFDSDLEVRPTYAYDSARYNIEPYKIYPKMKILPLIKRNGFKNNFHEIAPHKLFSAILANSYAETLLKAKQYNLLCHSVNHPSLFTKGDLWPVIKICIRHHYFIKDAQLWIDYLDLLKYFNLDLHNSKYVCPKSLKNEHDRLMIRKRRVESRLIEEQQRIKRLEYEQQFKEKKAHLLGICIDSEKIKIKTLDSVQEYMEEGDILHHCIYTNEYFLKENTLCLSARMDDKPLETIELSLSKMKIVQCRGSHNSVTPYHDDIVKLLNDNINVIKSRYRKSQKEKLLINDY